MKGNGRKGRPPRQGRVRGSGNPIDAYVGARVRLRRNMLGMSQEKLGEHLQLTFQQVQKYERGANRIGASRLHELSQIFGVPVEFFFDHTDPVRAPAIAETPAMAPDDPFAQPDVLALVAAYYAVPDEPVRRRLFDLAKALASQGS